MGLCCDAQFCFFTLRVTILIAKEKTFTQLRVTNSMNNKNKICIVSLLRLRRNKYVENVRSMRPNRLNTFAAVFNGNTHDYTVSI